MNRTKEEMLDNYDPNKEYPCYYHEDIIFKIMQEFADQEVEKEKEKARKLMEVLKELLEQYHYSCIHYAKEAGISIEKWVEDLPTYQKAKAAIDKYNQK